MASNASNAFNMPQCLFALLVLIRPTTALPLQNITLPFPVGTSNHQTPGLLCVPTKWTDVIMFYLLNYVAHAATVLTRPGERSVDYLVSVIGSVLYPTMGMYRGVEAILSGAVFVKNDDLRKAARSGALCMVVRGNDWRPVDGDQVRNSIYRRAKEEDRKEIVSNASGEIVVKGFTEKIEVASQNAAVHIITYVPPWLKSKFGLPAFVHRQIVHGRHDLPKGYQFAKVPSNTQFTASTHPSSTIEVSATYNVVKAVMALVQAFYATSTIFMARGDQIEQFGFAAFGLTVAPYAVMSMINLIGNLCRPDYPSLYMVENGVMDEARRRGGVFEGAVGRVQEQASAVCARITSDGEDVGQLHFSANDEDTITANMSPRHPESPGDVDKPLHTHAVKPLPEKLDYSGTQDDALILIPCCDPVDQIPTSDAFVPNRHSIVSLSLTKAWILCKRFTWTPIFSAAPQTRMRPLHWQLTKYLGTILVGLAPLFINAALTRFRTGSIPKQESSTWRVYAIQLLVMGVASGIWWVIDQEGKDASPSVEMQIGPSLRVFLYVVGANPAIGGFVVVGQMLAKYGVCTWVGD
ncbi:hypothetical protein CC80DRAFT_460797 [Byssothecium circinans]|uniref:Uncharacterized protein n=1 Tax=Byssothecium circinans TaxID=147558 RepID=A0A6A5UF33_9PLEO|nr:hypothetical protein CC80DRAFT_460797 [Byssothecium circinans]